MDTLPHRRLLWLFLVVVLLPCAALLAISLRIAWQERELSERRQRESHELAVRRLGQDLLLRLEKIRQDELRAWTAPDAQRRAYHDGGTVLVARIEHERLLLPWQDDGWTRQARQERWDPSFRKLIDEGEQHERAGRVEAAAATYRRAMEQGKTPFQSGYAQLLLARALDKAGRSADAAGERRALLALPASVRDEYGVPLAFYAAERLASRHAAEALGTLSAHASTAETLSPPALYMLRDLLAAVTAGTEPAEAAARVAEQQTRLERVLALAAAFPQLWPVWAAARHASQTEPVWLLWGEPAWWLSVAPAEPTGAVLVALDAAPLLAEFAAERPVHFLPAAAGSGQPLGRNFPGVAVSLPWPAAAEEAGSQTLQRSFSWFAALVVVTVALFGTHVLVHGVRRELRLAALRTQFVSSVSHELKTPLTAIRMFADSLRMGRPADPAARAEYLDTIISESERLTRLLNNVLDFSKLERGAARYQFRPVYLQDVLAAAARAVSYPLAQQGFELQTAIDQSLRPVRADADAMQQAVLNLLSNAIKYSGEARWIGLGLRAENGHAVVEVHDHGLGIPAREHRRIFDKFYRVPPAAGQEIPGTGLGLTLVEHVVHAHGGAVEVDSAPGKGSTFRLRLPLESNP
jgi:signal transduction histidine kinase